MSKTKKIVNMLADNAAAPAAARSLAKAAEREGKLISDYLTERLQHDRLQHDQARWANVWDKTTNTTAEARERTREKDEKFVPSEPPPQRR